MAPRYLFLCPDHTHAAGGTAVLYDCVAQLRHDGHDAVLVHLSASARYPNSPHVLPTYYSRAVIGAHERRLSLPRRVMRLPDRVRAHLGPFRNPPLRLGPDDILVVPEFWLSLAVAAFPGRPKVVVVQNPFTYLDSHADALARGLDPSDGHLLSIGGAQSCLDALDLTGTAPVAYLRVTPDLALFPWREAKSRRVAYMPRKRRREADQVCRALERRGNLRGYELVCVDGMTQAQVAEVLGDCRFFLSLMEKESLGFPGIEAMAAGCVVVGYTGVGGREYFTADTGRPDAGRLWRWRPPPADRAIPCRYTLARPDRRGYLAHSCNPSAESRHPRDFSVTPEKALSQANPAASADVTPAPAASVAA